MTGVSVLQIFFNISLWIIALLYACKQIFIQNNNIGGYFLLGFITVLFSTFGFNSGDFVHYFELYDELIKSQFIIHVEPFYFWLCKVLPDNYFLWRFVIWGLATLFYIKALKKVDCSPKFAMFIFVLILMWTFNNLRNALGYSVLLYGAALILFPARSRVWTFFRGGLMIFLSFFLHKSMFMYILIMCFALIPIGKKLFISSLLLFPILYKSVTYISSYILFNSFANETSQDSGMRYLESDFVGGANINGLIQIFITRLPILLLLSYSIRNIFFKNEYVSYSVRVFLQFAYWLIYISYLFSGQKTSAFLTNRFWDASLYPITIFLAVYLYDKVNSLFVRNCFILLLLANLYNISYTIFKIL